MRQVPLKERRDDEVAEILGDRPDECGDAPGNKVEDQGGFAPPKFIGDGPAQQCAEDLDYQADADQQANLAVF